MLYNVYIIPQGGFDMTDGRVINGEMRKSEKKREVRATRKYILRNVIMYAIVIFFMMVMFAEPVAFALQRTGEMLEKGFTEFSHMILWLQEKLLRL